MLKVGIVFTKEICSICVHEQVHSWKKGSLLNILLKWFGGKLVITVQIQVSSAMKTIDASFCVKIYLKCLCQSASSHPPCVSPAPTLAWRMSKKIYFKLSA